MISIIYPNKKPQIKTQDNKELIFCSIRKRWFIITPEEWVRQNFLLYLTEVLQYPASLISVEKQIILAELKKRFDIIIYKNDLPFMIIECKEMNIPLAENTIRQVLNYNSLIQAPYIVITNGKNCKAFNMQEKKCIELNDLPEW